MSSLVDFLVARIAEDEAAAKEARERNLPFWVAQEMGRSGGSLGVDYVNRFSPARVLAECESKRWVVTEAAEQAPFLGSWESVLHWLALPYANHHDFQPEWRPEETAHQ